MKPGTKMRDYSKPAPQSNPAAPRKRIIKRVEPFSPWQTMVHDRCTELGISTRALADKIATSRKRHEHTTLWAWLRTPEGTPPSNSYTEDLNRRLAAAINVHPDILATAYEESRRKFMISSPTPAQVGPMGVLRMLFAGSNRETWTKAEIVKVIDDIRGC